MLLQDIRAQINESRLGCHASLTGYTTAMKTRTDIPVLAHPPYVSIKRDYVLTWVYCISCGMICSSFMAMTWSCGHLPAHSTWLLCRNMN